ncbi:MAG: cytochrome c family protein [Maricaulaceae bacterium]
MGDLGFNKIAAAILATGLGYMMLKEASHLVLHAEAPLAPAYALELPEPKAAGEKAEKPLPFPQADWVAAMDVTKGKKVFKKCQACHNVDNGGANSTGPNLWGIVGAAGAQNSSFKYSNALNSAGITWDYETLDGFLAKPSKYLKGTNMSFIGVKKAADRAAVIAYLNSNSGAPLAPPVAAIVETVELETVETAVMEKIEEVMDAPKEIMEKVDGVMEKVEDAVDAATDGEH